MTPALIALAITLLGGVFVPVEFTASVFLTLALCLSLWLCKAQAWILMVALGVLLGYASVRVHAAEKKGQDDCGYPAQPIHGRIISIPEYHHHHLQFDFLVQDPFCHYTVRLNWYGITPYLQVNDVWQLRIKIHAPSRVTNPGQWDYSSWLKAQGMDRSGYVVGFTDNQLRSRRDHSFSMDVFRQKLASLIYHAVSRKEASLAAILAALSTGSRHLLVKEDWRVFQNTGTSHLVAISGLHVGLVAGLFYALTRQGLRFFPTLMQPLPMPVMASIVSLVAAFFYSLLAGFSVPTERALIMLSVVLISGLTHRHIHLWYRLLLAFALVLFFWPLAATVMSFWLSFFAVAMLGYCSNARLGVSNGWLNGLRLQIALCVALMPLTLLFFSQLSLVMVIANLVAIPYVSFIIVPACLVATFGYWLIPGWDPYLWLMAAKLLQPLWWYLTMLARYPVTWHQTITHPGVFCCLFLAVLLGLAPRGFPGKWLSIIFSLPLFFYHPARLSEGELQIVLFDRKRAPLLLILSQNHAIPVSLKKPLFTDSLLESYRCRYWARPMDKMLDLWESFLPRVWSWDGIVFHLADHVLQIQFKGRTIWVASALTAKALDHYPERLADADLIIFASQPKQSLNLARALHRISKKSIILSSTYPGGRLLGSGSGLNSRGPSLAGFYSTAFNGSIMIRLSRQGSIQLSRYFWESS